LQSERELFFVLPERSSPFWFFFIDLYPAILQTRNVD
jgi:hypothetical protein